MSVMLELCDTCILVIPGRILVNFAIAEVSELLSVERLCYCCHFYKDLMFDFGVPGKWYVQVFVPVSHCKDTHNFDKTNNFFKEVKKKESKCMLSSVRNLPNYSTNYVNLTLISITSKSLLYPSSVTSTPSFTSPN